MKRALLCILSIVGLLASISFAEESIWEARSWAQLNMAQSQEDKQAALMQLNSERLIQGKEIVKIPETSPVMDVWEAREWANVGLAQTEDEKALAIERLNAQRLRQNLNPINIPGGLAQMEDVWEARDAVKSMSGELSSPLKEEEWSYGSGKKESARELFLRGHLERSVMLGDTNKVTKYHNRLNMLLQAQGRPQEDVPVVQKKEKVQDIIRHIQQQIQETNKCSCP